MKYITPPRTAAVVCDSHETSDSGRAPRVAGLDVIRTIACITVIASHFFLHTRFSTSPFEGLSMFMQGMLAGIVVGSDLYMLLTGFLCSNKTVSKDFYKSGVKVILSYLFFSILTIVANIYFFHTGMTWKSGIMGILSFSTIPYAWYIEMWIGLFIMAPFLNIWYKALPSKRMKIALISILYSLTIFPDFCNRYGLYVVPQFWEFVYPLAFYFTGCFIKEYRPKVSRLLLLGICVMILLISPIVTMISGHSTYLHFTGDRNGAFMSALAISIFLACYNIDVKSGIGRKIFKMISLRSLDIFLCSAVLDIYIYPLFISRYFESQSQFGIYYLVIVLIVFASCFCIASIKRWIFDLFQLIIIRCGTNLLIQNR